MEPGDTALEAMLRKTKEMLKRIGNLKPLLKVWGLMGVSASQKAFTDQKFGDKAWPARYPNQSTPKLNIAGTLADFNAGRSSPKPNRFQDRPALFDEGYRGGLVGSLSSEVVSDTAVEWGTTKPYAALHQTGGQSTQPVTQGAKERISAWLFQKNGNVRKGRKPFVGKLWKLLGKTELTTKVHERPFVGIHSELASDMVKASEAFMEGKDSGFGK